MPGYTNATIFEQERDGIILPKMDVQATERAIEIMEALATRTPKWSGIANVPSTTAKTILESAAYRLRVQLRDYLTKGEGQ